MSNKLLTRFAEFVNNQTEEPTKKQLNKAIKKLYEKKLITKNLNLMINH